MIQEAQGEWLEGPPGYAPQARVRLVGPEGKGTSGILALGEAAGESEAKDGLPFRPYAEAGSVLERVLYRAGIQRDSLTIANMVWYRPPRNFLEGSPWEMDAIRFCQGMLQELVERVQPKVIYALGGVAWREATGISGPKAGIETTRGFIVPALSWRNSQGPIPIVGTHHPAALRHGSKGREGSEGGKTKSVQGGKGMALLGVLIRDLQLVQSVVRNGTPRVVRGDWREQAGVDDWKEVLCRAKLNPGSILCYDFETKDSLKESDESEIESIVKEVTQVQVGLGFPGSPEHMVVVSNYSPEILPIFRELMALRNPKLDWNGRKFDRPIARDLGVVFNGQLHDGMDLWHHAQPDLPRGLQYATSFAWPEIGPWKHLSGSSPHWYGVLDVVAPLKVYEHNLASLSAVRESHSQVSLWSGYLEQVVQLSPVLDRMSARGIPVDNTRRMELDKEFTATLQRVGGELQGLVPESLKGLHPKEGFVRAPKEVMVPCWACEGRKKLFAEKITKGITRTRLIKCHNCGGKGKLESEHPPEGGDNLRKMSFVVQVKCPGCPWAKNIKARGKLEVIPDCPRCRNTGKIQDSVVRWVETLEFLPGSWQQVLAYIKHKRAEDLERRTEQRMKQILQMSSNRENDRVAARKWAEEKTSWIIPTDYKSNRETTSEPELRRLAQKTGDPVLPKVLEYREVQKAKGTYVEGWAPDTQGRVHSTFGFRPATGQLSSEEPNAQNFPAHGILAQAMKKMIHAPEDHLLVNFDYKSFHVLTLGFEAQDPSYMRAARIDMHSFFALCGLLRLEDPQKLLDLPDDELKAKLKYYRTRPTLFSEFGGKDFDTIRNEKAKRAILGIGFGQGERSLYMLNPESFSSIAEAKRVLDNLNSLFPRPQTWREEIKDRADREHCLVSRHGFVRRFWDVLARRPVEASYVPRKGEKVMVNGNDRRWLLRPGDDAEAAIAFLPANDAFGTIRGTMTRLESQGLAEKFGLVNQVHDSLVFDCPKSLVEECLFQVKAEMERPNPRLQDPKVAPEGLSCQVEVKVGPSLGEMAEVKIQ